MQSILRKSSVERTSNLTRILDEYYTRMQPSACKWHSENHEKFEAPKGSIRL